MAAAVAGCNGRPTDDTRRSSATKQWHLLDATSRQLRPLTASLGVAVHDEDDDTPDPAGSYGSGGWTRDSKSFLVYDRYDVWQVFADDQPARHLTEGEGRKARIEFRVQRLEADDEDEGERGIDPAKPLYLRAVSEETRASGTVSRWIHGRPAAAAAVGRQELPRRPRVRRMPTSCS